MDGKYIGRRWHCEQIRISAYFVPGIEENKNKNPTTAGLIRNETAGKK